MATVFKRGGKANRHGYWYVSWYEFSNGRTQRRTKCTYTTDKVAADRIAGKYEADAALRREGVIDSALEGIGKEAQRTIESHLADYRRKLEAAGRSDKYITETEKYIRNMAQVGGFLVAGDIKADPINMYTGKLKDENKSARTIQAHLTAIKGFTKWLANNQKLPRDPLSSIQKPNPKTDRRRERRMLLPSEWQYLTLTMQKGSDRNGMTAHERLLLYRTAIETGLRAGELRFLRRTSIVLRNEHSYIRAKAGTTKNQKDARQYIQDDLAALLRIYTARKLPSAPVFNLPDPSDMASMLREDLHEGRDAWIKEVRSDPSELISREQSDFLAYQNHDGEVVDFHALRHTCGAWIAMTGAHPKVVQQVMRHSTITLTMDTYGHLFPGQEAEAVGKLGSFTGSYQPPLAATGTCDISRESRSARRSSEDTAKSNSRTASYEQTGKSATLPIDLSPVESMPCYGTLQPSTTLYDQHAPLAQLAEQLTLNQ